MSDLPEFVSLFDRQLGLSLEAPAEWTNEPNDVFPMALFAELEDGYRSSISFDRTPIKDPSITILEQAISESRAEQEAGYRDFKMVDERQFRQDDQPAYIRSFSWRSDDGAHHFAQLMAFVLTQENGLYDIHAVTLYDLRAKYMPIFIKIVASLRFVPLG